MSVCRSVSILSLCAVSACGGGAGIANRQAAYMPASARSTAMSSVVAGRLGAVLTTKDGGQIFGFDIDRNGTDGALASSKTTNRQGVYTVSVETFDQNSGAITHSFAVETGRTNSYGLDAIFGGDVALVTHYIVPKGTIYAKRDYDVMNPVTAQKFTGSWTPPIADIDVLQTGVNQATSESVLFAIELKNADNPLLIVTDIAKNTISKTIGLDPALFGGANGPQLGQFTTANQAVIALSPDAGRVGGVAPINVVYDLATGAKSQFTGFNNGPYGSGSVNGLAIDPNTGVAATTTELNAQVEFYDVKKRTGIAAVQMPCSGPADQLLSGSGISADPVHKLFLVASSMYGCGSGSAIAIYDERGKLVETVTGLSMAMTEPSFALNPAKRMGWAYTSNFSQLQQFFY